MAEEEVVEGGVATAESPAAGTGASESQASGAQSQSGGDNTAGKQGEQAQGAEADLKLDDKKTYTSKDVSKIISQRINRLNAEKARLESETKAWKTFGTPDQTQERLRRLELLEAQLKVLGHDGKAVNGTGTQQAEDPNTKAFKEFLFKTIPGLDNLSKMQETIQSYEQARWQNIVTAGQQELSKLAGGLGFKDPKQIEYIENAVAASIKSNDKDREDYLKTGNPEVLKKHFATVKEAILDPLLKNSSSQYSATKEKTKNLAPQMPKGGVPAPTAKGEKKMTTDERAAAAFEVFMANGGARE